MGGGFVHFDDFSGWMWGFELERTLRTGLMSTLTDDEITSHARARAQLVSEKGYCMTLPIGVD